MLMPHLPIGLYPEKHEKINEHHAEMSLNADKYDQIWRTWRVSIEATAFSSDMTTCGRQCALSAQSCASSCVQGKEGYSASCADCLPACASRRYRL